MKFKDSRQYLRDTNLKNHIKNEMKPTVLFYKEHELIYSLSINFKLKSHKLFIVSDPKIAFDSR